MATKAVCVLKSDKVNGVVHFNQEVISKLFYVLFVICIILMPSPSASSKFVLSVLEFLGILKILRYTKQYFFDDILALFLSCFVFMLFKKLSTFKFILKVATFF